MAEGLPKIFDDIDEHIIDKNIDALKVLRKKHPTYRDDQLLLWMLCKREMSEHDATPENVPYAGERR